MLIKKLSIIIIGILLPALLWAAPSISGYYGTMSSGQNILLHGERQKQLKPFHRFSVVFQG